jgi:hypothetical protein
MAFWDEIAAGLCGILFKWNCEHTMIGTACDEDQELDT